MAFDDWILDCDSCGIMTWRKKLLLVQLVGFGIIFVVAGLHDSGCHFLEVLVVPQWLPSLVACASLLSKVCISHSCDSVVLECTHRGILSLVRSIVINMDLTYI